MRETADSNEGGDLAVSGADSPLVQPSAVPVPAADVTAPPFDAGSFVHQSYPLLQAEEEATEVLIGVRGTTLRRVRRRLATVADAKFPWAEVMLGVSTLSLGATLGALSSNMPWAEVDGTTAVATRSAIAFYAILPAIGAASAVAYFCLRHFSAGAAATIAQDLLEDLPDPGRTKEVNR